MIEEIDRRVRQAPEHSALAYCFCDYKDPATHEARNLMSSHIAQSAIQDEDCYRKAQTLYDEHNPSNGPVSSYNAEELRQCLLNIIQSLDHAYIIIDALDECMSDRISFLEALHELNDFENQSVHTLFTGREELGIQRVFHDYEKLSIAANSQDIRLYVDSGIVKRSRNGVLNIRDPAFQEEMRKRLVDGAKGM